MSNVVIATSDSRVYDALSAEIAGEGHEVYWARDGMEAYDLTLARSAVLVFLEEELTVFDGYEVSDMLRGDPDVPASLPIYLLSDLPVEPHTFDRTGFTGRFPKTHGYYEVRELVAARIRPESSTW